MNEINLNTTQMQKIYKMLVASLLVALVSQVNLELFESDFVVSAGVVLFVIFLYYYDDFNPIPFSIVSGGMVIVLRLIVHWILEGDSMGYVSSYMPELVFYVIYSVFFVLFSEGDRKNNSLYVYILCILCDFASNFVEVFVRYTVLGELNLVNTVPTLIIVSLIRSTVVWVILNAFNYYNMMLSKKEHEERYKRLLLLTSQLKTEMFWIEKNMDSVEKVVAQSLELHKKINNSGDKEICSKLSLSIARDVNEIKKDNELVFRGIKDITEKQLKDKGMEYKDINNILSETMKRETKRCNKNIEFEFNIGENFYTMNHYCLMCILRNLIVNSMDSIRQSQNNAKISVIHEDNDEHHIFKVSDNGSGINEEYLREIFSPGFSTKVSNETGEVNRGLGLSIVKYIVEEQLNGKIEINSKVGFGTDIIICIPKISLNENIYSSIEG